jgi:uncharacterized phage protein (TIGR02220 family)
MHSWDQKGPIPLDEQECSGIANCRSSDEVEAMRYVLAKYFVRMDDGYYNLRMQKEIEKSENISKARSKAGKSGYESKALRRQAIAKQVLSNCQASASTPTPTPYTVLEVKTLTALSDSQKPESDFGDEKVGIEHQNHPPAHKPELWDFASEPENGYGGHYVLAWLNKLTGSRYRGVPANLRLANARLKEYSVRELRWMISIMHERWADDPRMRDYLRPKTLFAALNCAQYIETARREGMVVE